MDVGGIAVYRINDFGYVLEQCESMLSQPFLLLRKFVSLPSPSSLQIGNPMRSRLLHPRPPPRRLCPQYDHRIPVFVSVEREHS
jgi:hypothetical protein